MRISNMVHAAATLGVSQLRCAKLLDLLSSGCESHRMSLWQPACFFLPEAHKLRITQVDEI
jgi:hypothetical protein